MRSSRAAGAVSVVLLVAAIPAVGVLIAAPLWWLAVHVRPLYTALAFIAVVLFAQRAYASRRRL